MPGPYSGFGERESLVYQCYGISQAQGVVKIQHKLDTFKRYVCSLELLVPSLKIQTIATT